MTDPSPSRAAVCANHPDRPAVALCVLCRGPVCEACSTLWEGIHHCASCLAERRSRAEREGSAWGWVVSLLVIAAAGLLGALLRPSLWQIWTGWWP